MENKQNLSYGDKLSYDLLLYRINQNRKKIIPFASGYLSQLKDFQRGELLEILLLAPASQRGEIFREMGKNIVLEKKQVVVNKEVGNHVYEKNISLSVLKVLGNDVEEKEAFTKISECVGDIVFFEMLENISECFNEKFTQAQKARILQKLKKSSQEVLACNVPWYNLSYDLFLFKVEGILGEKIDIQPLTQIEDSEKQGLFDAIKYLKGLNKLDAFKESCIQGGKKAEEIVSSLKHLKNTLSKA